MGAVTNRTYRTWRIAKLTLMVRFRGVLTQMRSAFPNRTGSSAETLDMDNPENLEILKILVQTDADAVQSAILYPSTFFIFCTLLHLKLCLTSRKGPYITVSRVNKVI